MAINLTPLATVVQDKFNNLPTTMTLQQLWHYKQFGYEMALTNYDALDAKIQAHIDAAATASDEDLALMRMIEFPVKPIVVPTVEQQIYAVSGDIVIPADCNTIKITYQAAGGASGNSVRYDGYSTGYYVYSGQGGGGGGAVIDYEMTVAPNSTLTLTKGTNGITLGLLQVEAGFAGAGAGVVHSSAQFQPTATSGKGGKVLVNGVPFDDGVTAIKGGDASSNQTGGVAGSGTSNGKTGGTVPNPGYSSRYSDPQGNDYRVYYGSGGGASAASNGEASVWYEVDDDVRVPDIGAGASSHNAIDSNSANYDDEAQGKAGGIASPNVIIKFLRGSAT